VATHALILKLDTEIDARFEQSIIGVRSFSKLRWRSVFVP